MTKRDRNFFRRQYSSVNDTTKQQQLLDNMENMVEFFASKKYLIRGTQAELRRYDKYAKIMRDQLTKETNIFKNMSEKSEQTITIKETDKTPEEKYIEELENEIRELKKMQEKNDDTTK